MSKTRVAVLITGDRNAKSKDWAETLLMDFTQYADPSICHSHLLIHGAADGIDTIGHHVWRDAFGSVKTIRPYPAENYGRWPWCGPRRNVAMLERLKLARDKGWHCLVIAYHSDLYTGSKGTKHMAGIADAAGFDVMHRPAPRISIREMEL